MSHSFGDNHKLTYVSKKSFIPEAHTCFFELDVGDYDDQEDLKKKLLYGVENCHIIMESNRALTLAADFGM